VTGQPFPPGRPVPPLPATGVAGGLWPAGAGQRGMVTRRRLVAFLVARCSDVECQDERDRAP
jgi:hypothetical protein